MCFQHLVAATTALHSFGNGMVERYEGYSDHLFSARGGWMGEWMDGWMGRGDG